VKLVDANLLLYAINEDAPHHEVARGWLDGALGGREAVGFAWIVLLAFLRLSTRPGLFSRPLGAEEATAVVEGWLDRPPALTVAPTARHLGLLHGLLTSVGSAGNLVNDAHLAALAVEHGGEIVSFDGDFARFPGVRWHSPAAA
jgi:toxin-antitoxin system PIN domain toxin